MNLFACSLIIGISHRGRGAHDIQCSRLDGPLRDHISTTYGITRNSILNTSYYYQVADGLPPDCMHDLLEGVLPYQLKLMFAHYISYRQYFSLSDLNT